jgi:hypothetical protein
VNGKTDREKYRTAGTKTKAPATRWLPEVAGGIVLLIALINTAG